MQIVAIEIPKHLYKLLKDIPSDSNEGTIENALVKAVENGIPIPSGLDITRIIPKKVNVQAWMYTECPGGCGHELSTHHGDGYYSIENKPSYCPKCGQALLWGEKEEDEDEE